MPLFKKVVDFLSSFQLSVAILFFMFLVTLLGTWSQVEIGLFQSQKKYFEAFFVWEQLFGSVNVPILPGGVTLMLALAVNLLMGGMVRLKRTWSRVGILITHVGIAFLLVAGAVKFQFSTEGSLALFEGERGSEYVSHHEWEIAIEEIAGDDEVRQWLVPELVFVDRGGQKVASISSDLLPFRLEVYGYEPSANVLPKGPKFATSQPVVDGFFVQPLQLNPESQRDFAACYVRAVIDGAAPVDGILWDRARAPLTIRAADRQFGISLRKRRFPLPFEVELIKFTHEYHPGTGMPRVFASDVLVRAGGQPEAMKIEMNQPLRRDGFIAFQSSWGPQGARPGTRLFSVFTVVENPSDQWPLWATVVIGLGLSLHFGLMLRRYVRAELQKVRQPQVER